MDSGGDILGTHDFTGFETRRSGKSWVKCLQSSEQRQAWALAMIRGGKARKEAQIPLDG